MGSWGRGHEASVLVASSIDPGSVAVASFRADAKTYALQVLERVGCCELLGLEQVVLGDIEVALRLLNAIVAEFDTVSTVLYLILQMGAFQWLANGTPPAASFLDLAQLRKLRAELTYVFLSDHTRLHDGGAVVCFVGHFAK